MKLGRDKARILFLALSGALLLGGFLWRANQPPAEEYVLVCQQDFPILPFLRLDPRQGRFDFMIDSLSSFWPGGEYSIEGDRLILRCDQADCRYVFQILDRKTLRFLAGQSTEIRVWDDRLSPPIPDGALFRSAGTDGPRLAPGGILRISLANS